MRIRPWFLVASWLIAPLAAGQGFFLPAGDLRLRNDLTLLVDEGVINLPLNEWPLARQDVAKTQEEQCKKATERYDKAIQARRIFKTAPDGTKEYVSDAEADAYRAEALLDKEAACGPKPK